MISHVHHINFLVCDLNKAVENYQNFLGFSGFVFDSIESRAVKTARIKLADTWLVLVQPLDEESEPAKHLAKFGEGFFLMSFATNDLKTDVGRLTNNDVDMQSFVKRQGLENWSVIDLPTEQFFGAQLQLTEEVAVTQ